MKYLKGLAVAVLCLGMGAASAKTAQQLKTDLAGLMPSGKKLRACWTQGSISSYGTNNGQIWGVDSDDGVVRQITSGSINADWPCITHDGNRIFFYDNASGEVKIVNWSGGTISTLQANYVSGGEVSIESWVDPGNNSDWVIVGDACGGEVGRINIDNPSQCVKLWTCGSPCPSYGDGLGLSLDGTHLAAMWDLNGNFASGVGNVSNGTVKRHSTWIGCGVSMPADNTYRVSFAEQQIRISTGELPYTQTTVVSDVTSWVSSNNLDNTCHEWFEHASHRWTNHPDYLTECLYGSNANPFLYRITDKKFTAIQDNLSCRYVGHADVCYFSASTALSSPLHGIAGAAGTPVRQDMYSINGRALKAMDLRGAGNGIVIRRGVNQGSGKLQTSLDLQ